MKRTTEKKSKGARGTVWSEGGAGAKRSLVAGEITFCNSTVRRRILIPSINLCRSLPVDPFDPSDSVSSLFPRQTAARTLHNR